MIPIIVLVIVVFALFDSVVIVPEKSSRVIQRLGKFQRIAGPGLTFKLPVLDRVAGTISLKIQQLDVDIETKTMDNVFVDMKVSVQYVIQPLKIWDAFYKLEDPVQQIASYVFDDVRAEVPKLELDDVFF